MTHKVMTLFAALMMSAEAVVYAENNVVIDAYSPAGTIGTIGGREAFVVDLGGTIGKVAVATKNIGAASENNYGTHFRSEADFNPDSLSLADGWYVPTIEELTALKDKLQPSGDWVGVEYRLGESLLYFPGILPEIGAGDTYVGKYLSSSRESDTYMSLVFFYNPGYTILAGDNSKQSFPCAVRLFHKMPPLAKYIDLEGKEQAIAVTEITNETTTLTAGWYAVLGNDVQTGTLACTGAVNIILADGAKLTATGSGGYPGIHVSGTNNSLTIYGQAAQSGQLTATTSNPSVAGIGGKAEQSGDNITINGGIITAIGGNLAAGIGGGNGAMGSNITINGGTVTACGLQGGAGIGGGNLAGASNITINGGTVTATGGEYGAGIGGGGYGGNSTNITINGGIVTATGGQNGGAGIGGGFQGKGTNITINGGMVTATGGESTKYSEQTGTGIGGVNYGSNSSNIFVLTALTVYADNTNPPTTEISHVSTYDIANHIANKQFVIVKDIFSDIKKSAIDTINAAIKATDNDNIKAIVTEAVSAINTAATTEDINNIKKFALDAIASAQAAYAAGKAETLGQMAEPCNDCPAVKVKKGDTEITLYAPEQVTYDKTPSEQ